MGVYAFATQQMQPDVLTLINHVYPTPPTVHKLNVAYLHYDFDRKRHIIHFIKPFSCHY